MKKIAIILAVLVFCCSLLPALDVSGLSADKQREFFSKALSIDVGTQTTNTLITSGYVWDFGYNSTISVGTGVSESETVWTPYQGYSEISKLDFFELTGEKELAEQTRQFEAEMKKYRNIMWACFGGGTLVSIAGLIATFTGHETIGIIGTIGGLCIMAVGIPFEIESNEDQNISAQFVIGIADAYNTRLLESIK